MTLLEKAVRSNRDFPDAAAFINDELATAVEHAVHTSKIARRFDEKSGIRPGCAISRIEIGKRWPAKDARFRYQDLERLVQTGGPELEAARERLSIRHMTPDVQPRVIGRSPNVSEKQLLRGICGCDPAE